MTDRIALTLLPLIVVITIVAIVNSVEIHVPEHKHVEVWLPYDNMKVRSVPFVFCYTDSVRVVRGEHVSDHISDYYFNLEEL